MSRRLVGIAVAILACLLNYALLLGVTYWMFTQIKSTHDPYNIDELMLSPYILRSTGWPPFIWQRPEEIYPRLRCCSQKQTLLIGAMAMDE